MSEDGMDEERRITILHVDDDPAFLDLAETYLTRDFPEFDVRTVGSPEAALNALAETDVECVVSDHDMPGTTGLELLHTVQATRPDIPFILFTGKGSEEIAAEAMQAGADGYVQKGGTETFGLLGTQIRNVVTASRMETQRQEREKELSVLHRATLVLFEDRERAEKLHDFVHIIPAAWRFAEHTAARVTVGGDRFSTPNFEETEWMQRTAVETSRGTVGSIEIAYINEWQGNGAPFQPEEAELLDSLGNLLEEHLERSDLIAELQRTNEEFRTLLDTLPALVYLKDVEGRYRQVNEEFLSRVDMAEDEVIGKTPETVLPAEFAETVVEHDQITLERRETTEFRETRWRNGEPTTYLSIRVPLLDEDGDPYAMYGISTDITDQIALIEEHDRILDRMTDSFYALDSDWRFTYVNDAAARVLQRDAAELVGKRIWEEFPNAADSSPQAQFERAMETQETVEFDYYYGPADVLFEVSAYPSPSGLSVYFRDVTDDRAVEQELEEYRTMVETVGDPMYVIDETGRMTKVNRAMAEYLGRDREAVIGMSVFEVLPDADAERGTEAISELLRDGDREFATFEMRVKTDDGERMTEAKFGLLTEDGAYRGAVGVVRDISDRKAYEEELERQNQRLEEFASIVSHDLRNPLTVAEGYLEIAREECPSSALENVENAHTRMRQLIDDLLFLAREGKMITSTDPVHLGSLVKTCWETVSTGDAKLIVGTERQIQADSSRLRQLVENVMRNSVEHGPGQGVSGSSNGHRGPSDGQPTSGEVTITVGDLHDGFYIADDGAGIDPENRDDVFTLGYTTGPSGTGFGLAIVKQIADAHGWEVHLTESEAGGARFEFTDVLFADDNADDGPN